MTEVSDQSPAPPPGCGLFTIGVAALLFLIGLASNWSSAPTSQFMLHMQSAALFGSLVLLLLGAIAIAVPRLRIPSVIIAVAMLTGYIYLISR